MGDSMATSREPNRYLVVGLGGRTVKCALCRLVISFDDAHATVLEDVLASHWHDDHGLPDWRDRAADARYRLVNDQGWELLDQLRAMA